MHAAVVEKDALTARLAHERRPLLLVLDAVLERSDGPTALRQGRRGVELSRQELLKGGLDVERVRRTLKQLPGSGPEFVVLLNDVSRQFLGDPAWGGHPVVLELATDVMNLSSLLLLDPEVDDPKWEIREQVEQIRDLLRTLEREIEHSAIDDPRIAVSFVLRELEGVDQKDLAALLGFASERSVRDLRTGRATTVRKHPDRIVLIAQLVYDLRHAMSANGVIAWFHRKRWQLGGASPLDLIEHSSAEADEPLRALAHGVRGQLAT